jgi:hypothetical protein
MREMQGYEKTTLNKASFDQCVRIFGKCGVIESRKKDRAIIQATSASRMAFQRYSNLLKIPDIHTRSKTRRRNRVLIFINGLMPVHVPNSFLPWNSLKGNFPYLDYASGQKINCKTIEAQLGMSFVEFECQRPLESKYIFFKNDLSYTKDEIKGFCERIESIRNNTTGLICRPIEVNGKIYEGIEDQLLCDYISRMQFLLLAYKYDLEYQIISQISRLKIETLKEAFSNISMTHLYIWYLPTFGTKAFSTYVNLPGIKYFRNREENQDDRDLQSRYYVSVLNFLRETTHGKTFQDTRKKYSLLVNEIQDIVLRYFPKQKEEYKAR